MNTSRSLSDAFFPTALLCALASVSANAHAATRETATLNYTTLASCPDEAGFRRKVTRHLGYDPFEAEAKRFLSVSFVPKGKNIEATARLQRPGKADSVRTLSDTADHCEALAEAVAGGIATVIDPVQAAALQNASSLQSPSSPAVVQAAPAAPAEPAARNDATATTRLHITTDWGQGELIQHLGTSYGTGYVGGHAATVTTFHMQRLCRLPCDVNVATEGNYYVDAPGMHARQLSIPAGALQLDAKVQGASQFPLTMSLYGVYLGAATALTGGIMWAVFNGQTTGDITTDATGNTQFVERPYNTDAYQAMTYIGSGVVVAGIAGLIFFPRTHVEASDGSRLDARVRPVQKGIGVSPQGFTF